MKRTSLLLSVVALTFSTFTYAAEHTAISVATWSATAKKDTTSKLVVTPVGSLTFDYAAGLAGFNTQKGLFDVTIEGNADAKDFSLESKVLSSTLSFLGSDPSTLEVGVMWNGIALDKASYTTILDTKKNINGGNLFNLASIYKTTGRSSAQENFTFNITSASDGTAPLTNMEELPDGVWTGDVKVEFLATWTTA
ncbi:MULTISPECIES: common pilus major fimbrillin subunit EcpA [Erwinia]|uniref:common pilus major fimbrillin subunit EcpA n=1 Tax=Erwinia TaxID=551 RepID=UPI0005583390|nr:MULTISPECIES: common pilus major fimbrillin subunit EcpA [Erwinia]